MRCDRSGPPGPLGETIGKLLLSLLTVLGLLLPSGVARADGGSGEAIGLPAFRSPEITLIWVVLASGIVSVLMGVYWYRLVANKSAGTERMEEVGKAIRDGANAYLSQQVRAMTVLVVIVAIGLFFLYYKQANLGYGLREAFGVAFFFVLGVGASYLAGYIGMSMATIANQRTADQARRTFKGALETAFQAGAVSGMMTVGLGLIGACAVFLIYREKAMLILIGFGFGGSLAALFMRVGGGIFTRRPTSAPTWWARSKRASRRTIRATRPLSRTMSATTSATAPAWRPTCSKATRSRSSRRSFSARRSFPKRRGAPAPR
jgi:K(+)-stimulated pyrophosphate-energized sodium pump